MQVGSDDDGRAVRLKLKHYLAYARCGEHAGADDAPLYIFDGTFGERRGSRALCRDYRVPHLFSEDLLQHAGARRRPPYRRVQAGAGCLRWCRLALGHAASSATPLGGLPPPSVAGRWPAAEQPGCEWGQAVLRPEECSCELCCRCRWVVWGPARSGSNLHTDPLGTGAWNALLQGHKRWALFPPGTPRGAVLPRWPAPACPRPCVVRRKVESAACNVCMHAGFLCLPQELSGVG